MELARFLSGDQFAQFMMRCHLSDALSMMLKAPKRSFFFQRWENHNGFKFSSSLCSRYYRGLPHGALDPVLAYRHRLYTNNQEAIRFHLLYLLISLVALGIWVFIPVISLACFLLYSIVHFGRDWSDELPYKGLAYGCIILGAPALFHQAQVNEIFKVITFNQSSIELTYFLQAAVACGMALMLPSKSTLNSKLWIS